MASQQDKDIAWRRCCASEKAARDEDRTCKRQGRHTLACGNLMKDARKLKDEYERLCRQPTSNPLSIKHGEKFTRAKIVGELMGRSGQDTHYGVDSDKDRRPE